MKIVRGWLLVACVCQAAIPAQAAWAADTTPPMVGPKTKPPVRHAPKPINARDKKKAGQPHLPTAQDAAVAAEKEAAAKAHEAAVKAAAAKAAAKAALPPKAKLAADVGTATGLHLPRYAALKSDAVNMRKGPGMKYPIDWLYQRRELPVKILREFDIWRLIEDMDGIKGWVQTGTLNGHRSFVVTTTEPAILRADAHDDADPVAKVMPGAVGRIKTCDAASAWCQVQTGGYKGYLPRSAFWGADPGEAIVP